MRFLLPCLLWVSTGAVWAEPVTGKPAEILRQVASEGSWSVERTREFLGALLVDDRLQPAETGWLKALTAGTVAELQVPAPQGRSRDLMALMVKAPNWGDLWNGTPAQMQLLVDVSLVTPRARERILQLFKTRVATAWQSSSRENQFQPVADDLGQCFNKLKALGEPTRKPGCFLLHEACVAATDPVKGPIPTFFYNWLIADYK